MKNLFLLVFYSLISLCVISLTSCNQAGNKALFNGKNSSGWQANGKLSADNGLMTISGKDTKAVFKGGKYKNFLLKTELKTTAGGKGAIWFHTDSKLTKGYQVTINNDRQDPVWWKMSGSLLSVRNLTKSFIQENEWYTMDVKVEGKLISIYINGNIVVEYVESDAPYRIDKNKNTILSEGTFALVSEGDGEIIFKTIEVISLPDSETSGEKTNVQASDEQHDAIIKLHQEDFPVLDYHIHLKGGLTNEDAAKLSRKTGINYAIAPNCGIGFPITDDAGVMDFLNSMRTQPFILAMQAEGREWVTTFSQGVRDEFDYVFTDALTFTDSKGRRTRLWIPEETWIENEQQYMDLIVDRICSVLQEPMDIYVNPCFLPEKMEDRYDEFWTEARMNKFIDALAKSGKALEINSRYRIPNKAIIQKAKDAGVKFTFGTNNGGAELGLMEYAIQMKYECGITANDMYKPKIKI